MKKDLLREKSYAITLQIIKLSKYLQAEHKAYILSKETICSGTSMGALTYKTQCAQSKVYSLHKLMIANETKYWLLLFKESEYLNDKMLQSIQSEINKLLKLLIFGTKKIKENPK